MIGVETAGLYPQITLGASSGVAGTPAHLLSADGFGASIGPALSWHWPNRRVAKARVAAAGANADTALASFDGVVLQALRQTETRFLPARRNLNARSLWRRRVGMQRERRARSSSTVSAGSIFSTCFRPSAGRCGVRIGRLARSALTGRWIFSCRWVEAGLQQIQPRAVSDPLPGSGCRRRLFRKVPPKPVFIH